MNSVIIGCILAYAINILLRFFERWYDKLFRVNVWKKAKRVVCLILSIISLAGILVGVVYLIVPELINCMETFVELMSDEMDKVEKVIKMISDEAEGTMDSIKSTVSSVFSVAANVVIGFVFSIYILAEKEKLGAQCKKLISTYLPKVTQKIFYVTQVLDESFHNFIVGQCIEAVILGTLCVLGMWIFQFPYAMMIGVFVGFTALIPVAGAYIGAAVGAIMIFTVSPFKALPFLVFIVVLQQVEGNVIYPKVVGKSIGLPGIWVLAAITIGGGLFGIGGMLFAVPLAAAAYRLLKEDMERRNETCVQN